MNGSVELLSELIQNKCVNTGEVNSGNESKSVDSLINFFSNSSSNIQIERHHKIVNRDNLIIRIEGSDSSAPSLALLGHLDVVPATVSDWAFDPFGGELKDGFVQGRGAIDMLNLTSSMAIALKELIDEGFKPRGNLIFIAVADEENGGSFGADYLLREHTDLVSADFVLTESGGTQMPVGSDIFLPLVVGEKGVHWTELDVQGVPSHGSKPYGTDNAIVTASEIINRFMKYKSPLSFTQAWETFLTALGIDKAIVAKLASQEEHDIALMEIEQPLSGVVHSCCHNTFSPNTIVGGTKINTVADHVKLGIDIRSLPGLTNDDVANMIFDALGDLKDKVSVSYIQNEESSISTTDNEFYDILEKVSKSLINNSKLLPTIASYGTDARFYRRNGSIAYGFGLFSPKISYVDHLNMFHSRNEKVDVESLELTKEMYKRTIKELL